MSQTGTVTSLGWPPAYGFGIAKNHPFVDGNKRTALVVAETFLNLNGLDLTADDAACVAVIVAVADGKIKESKFARWIQDNIKPATPYWSGV